jgi:hypothetical protein
MVPTQRNSPIQLYSFSLFGPSSGTQGQVKTINTTGTMVRIKDCDREIMMAFDDGPFFPIAVGLGIQLRNSDFFTKLSFRCDDPTFADPSPLPVTVYVGNVDVLDFRLNSRFDRYNPVYVKESPSTTVGQVLSLAAATNFTIINRTTGNHRKQLVISFAGTNGLQLQTLAGVPIFNIQPGSPFTIFSSDGYLLRNTSGSAITVSIMEILYA